MTDYYQVDVTLVTLIEAENEEKAKAIGQQYGEDVSKFITDNRVEVDFVDVKSNGLLEVDL